MLTAFDSAFFLYKEASTHKSFEQNMDEAVNVLNGISDRNFRSIEPSVTLSHYRSMTPDRHLDKDKVYPFYTPEHIERVHNIRERHFPQLVQAAKNRLERGTGENILTRAQNDGVNLAQAAQSIRAKKHTQEGDFNAAHFDLSSANPVNRDIKNRGVTVSEYKSFLPKREQVTRSTVAADAKKELKGAVAKAKVGIKSVADKAKTGVQGVAKKTIPNFTMLLK